MPASALRTPTGGDMGGKYGAKLTKLVNKVKQLVGANDRVIVFVQFPDLKAKVVEALEDNSIRCLQVKGSVDKQVKALDILQKEIPEPGDPKVILLTMDDESSAGVNLTTCE